MRRFLQDETGIDISPTDIEGYRVDITGPSEDEFIHLKSSVESVGGNDVYFVANLHNGRVLTSATIGNNIYRSSQSMNQSQVDAMSAHGQEGEIREMEPRGYGLVDSTEYAKRENEASVDNGGVRTLAHDDCQVSVILPIGTDYIPEWLCQLVSVVGGITLSIYPEPTSTYAGIGVLTLTATSGGCTVAHTFEDETGTDLSGGITVCFDGGYTCYWDNIPPTCQPNLSSWITQH